MCSIFWNAVLVWLLYLGGWVSGEEMDDGQMNEHPNCIIIRHTKYRLLNIYIFIENIFKQKNKAQDADC
jgi:hypothetical protein